MAITQKSRWDDTGQEPPAGEARYVAGEQPIAEYDNWFNYSVSQDISALNAYLDQLGIANGVLTKDIDANGFGINNVGDIIPDSDNTRSLGSASARWANVYAANVRPTEIIFPDAEDVQYFIKTEDGNASIALEGGTTPSLIMSVGALVYLEMGGNIIYMGRDVFPKADNTYDLGTSTRRWANVYAVNVVQGDSVFDNGWRITEAEKLGLGEGLILISPDGRKFRFVLEEVAG